MAEQDAGPPQDQEGEREDEYDALQNALHRKLMARLTKSSRRIHGISEEEQAAEAVEAMSRYLQFCHTPFQSMLTTSALAQW